MVSRPRGLVGRGNPGMETAGRDYSAGWRTRMSKAFQDPKASAPVGFLQVSNIRLLAAGPVGVVRGQSMFEGFRYRLGKNMALLSLEGMPGFSPDRVARMRAISGNAINQEFGAAALKIGAAADRYCAAAAVFARLANAADDTPTSDISASHWTDAGHKALLLSRCPPDAVAYVFQNLRMTCR